MCARRSGGWVSSGSLPSSGRCSISSSASTASAGKRIGCGAVWASPTRIAHRPSACGPKPPPPADPGSGSRRVARAGAARGQGDAPATGGRLCRRPPAERRRGLPGDDRRDRWRHTQCGVRDIHSSIKASPAHSSWTRWRGPGARRRGAGPDRRRRRALQPSTDCPRAAEARRTGRALPSARIPLPHPYSNLRNHRKMLVVDGGLGFCGGLNIRDSCLLARHSPDATHDIHFRVRGPVVAHLLDAFMFDWEFTTRERLEGSAWTSAADPAGSIAARGIPDGPDEDFETLVMTILGALAQRAIGAHRHALFSPRLRRSCAARGRLARGRRRIVLPEHGNLRLVTWAAWRRSRRSSRGDAGSFSPRPRSTTRSCSSSTTPGRSSGRRTGIRAACASTSSTMSSATRRTCRAAQRDH